MIVAAALLAASAALQEGLAAVEAERYDEAITRLESAPDLASSYDGLVGLAVARGRVGRLDGAEASLASAIRLAPGRPEARIERGGLRFLQKRYEEAASDLRAALRRQEDDYARDLLASSLLLLERPVEAIESWNRVGEPRLARLTLTGLQHTKDAVVRRELRFEEGGPIDADALRASLRALDETGLFPDVRVRGSVRQRRELELELLMTERHGFGQPVDLATATLTNLIVGRARLRYANFGGRGISAGGFFRWEGVRPRVEATVDWARPFGVAVQWRVAAYRETQPYDVDGGLLVSRARGVDMRFRRVLGARNAAEAVLRFRRRTFDRPEAFARSGRAFGIGAGFERTLVATPRHRLEARLEGFVSGETTHWESGRTTLLYRLTTSAPREGRAPASQVVLRGVWAKGSGALPLDQMYALGTSPDAADYPMRGHHLRHAGVMGAAPIGREVRLANIEWRWEAHSRPLFGAGMTLFHDLGYVPVPVVGADRVLFDLGMGIRLRFGPSSIIRIDYGRDLRDNGEALTVTVGETF